MPQKNPWYLSTLFICLLFALWYFFIPPVIGIVLLCVRTHKEKQKDLQIAEIYDQNTRLSESNIALSTENTTLKQTIEKTGITEYSQAKEKIAQLESEGQAKLDKLNQDIQDINALTTNLWSELEELQQRDDKLKKSVSTQERKLSRSKELYSSMDYALNTFFTTDAPYSTCRLTERDINDAELIAPSVILKLHCMDVKSLKKAYRENEKLIESLMTQYSARYTTKANRSIYELLTISIQSEVQNILYTLKYDKLDTAIESIKKITAKYLKIAGEGNQAIAGTLTKFIGEMEYLLINSIKIEYHYYAEERKALEQEKKRILKEEEKFNGEITKLQHSLEATSDDSEVAKLKARILELQSQLSDVVVKKEEITNLQNGKAGTVYIISNLGSFGEDVFKVGMTRRLDPNDRINELGNASVPFKFDVHSFIFSQDAVALENKMHEILNDRRVNKVNMRKEFFKISIDELEKIVDEIEPTAEFNRTMVADEFRQSLSSDSNYTSTYSSDDDEEDLNE